LRLSNLSLSNNLNRLSPNAGASARRSVATAGPLSIRPKPVQRTDHPAPAAVEHMSIDQMCSYTFVLLDFDVHMPQEVADDFERNATLQEVHSFRVSQSVWAHRLREARVIAPYWLHMLLQEVAHARAR